MPQKNSHPSHSEFYEALTGGPVPFENHLKHCKACQIEWQLLKLVFPEGRISAPETPSELHLARLEAIPILKADRLGRSSVSGEVAYDSWSGLSPMQVRDAARGFERRLRLRAGHVELEIVAERELAGWKFSARAYVNGEPSGGFVLKVGRKILTPEFRNCFYWSSERPPRTIRLLSTSKEITFAAILWPGK
jgi:hypothetical protein